MIKIAEPLNNKKIIIADDEAFNIKVLMGLFRVLGMQDLEIEQKVDSCFNGEQLVNLVEKAIRENEPDRYSLIMTDYSMPIMDGHIASREVRRIIENENVNLKIVVVTGHVEQ